ncbi:protein kinase [Candidatus Mycobacterium wuenschmannii]|uniref:non-specific serine/threonine protein kinase n=1 Tax=Candidatus Mycobacterium wuenschmannii TaxID=3027808 RepID=A0ABY8W2I1_9MYCO|nr:serine/threonine protein kinase [Candidatus Mycobacterium wuenschmannii]WIM89316.1 protein kinase [Candidatus Mycobacterium wuenschmannii]
MQGTQFGRYQLQTLLGRGGMGEVWRAHDTATHRVVALKVLPAHLADDNVFQERFRREAQVAAALNEPHIVPIHNYGEIDGRLYVDMRLIEGRDLESVLNAGPLEPRRAIKIVDQVASALQAAHAAGLVHRDVKPSNVLVTNSDFAYLIDFGIARTIGETGLTATGSAIGTWAYMAPERFGTGRPDARSDVYALTCVLHQTLTGERPFPGDSVEQQVAGHLSTPPPRPSVVKSGLPHAIDDVIARGMAKDPNERFATANELSDAAHTAIEAAPPFQAEPPTQQAEVASAFAATQQRTPGYTTPAAGAQVHGLMSAKPSRRSLLRPRVVVPAVAVVAALVAGAVWVSVQDGRPAPPTRTHPAASRAPTGPRFDGVYIANFSAQKSFSGKAQKGNVPSQKWLLRSSCSGNRCIATASEVGPGGYTPSLIFDYVDGRWLAVAEGDSANECSGGDPSPRWVVVSVKGNSDTLTGTYSTDGETGCGRRSTVTFTRSGDAHQSLVEDPSKLPARVASPASALRGRYHSETTNPGGSQHDYIAATDCLRSGKRCLSSFTDSKDGSSRHFNFADDKWTRHSTSDTKCKNGTPQHNEWAIEGGLPQPPQDPIAVWKIGEHLEMTGGCSGSRDYESTFTRTGD